jgi:hypothetical protein
MEPFQPQVTGSRLDTELGIQSEISSFSLLHCRNQDKSFLKYFFKSALTLVEKQKPSTGGAGPKARGTTSPPKTMTPGLPDPLSGVWAQHRSTTILKSYTTPHLSPTLHKACDITTARQSGRTSNPPSCHTDDSCQVGPRPPEVLGSKSIPTNRLHGQPNNIE